MTRLLIAAALLLGMAPGALAHAYLDHASPAVGATVAAPPTEIQIWFTEAVEPAFSSIEVTDEAGHRVDTGKVQRDAADRTLLKIAVGALHPGTYTVTWHVTAVDTHRTEGHFAFTVAGR